MPKQSSNKQQAKNPAAVALGRLGGKVGGAARAASLSPEKRSEIARIAAQKRWHRNEEYPRAEETAGG